MRAIVVGGVSLVLISLPCEAQQRDSSYWTLGVSRGSVSTSPFAQAASGSAASLQVEWRRIAARLGVRAEISVAQRDQTFTESFTGCQACFSDSRSGTASALASLVYSWRNDRMLRPYAILGAGILRDDFTTTSNYSQLGLDGFEKASTPFTMTRSRMGLQVAGGLGLSANVGRFSVFGETRARSRTRGPTEQYSIGIRIRPD